ncbi:16S rRNA (cytidine(1402)-2'-O)-methyltransferase [Patescibacteria group bacterium]|nr:16S rRNA (cytidine(1402)-2'-O)-methyltransferase [Patescibacteria group bacterium]
MEGKLYIIATPIGNLGDITLRAVETLKSADLVLAEDTRVAGKLLAHLGAKKPIWRFDEYAAAASYEKILSLLEEGKNIAFVSDAGTPNVADPGAKLVAYLRDKAPEAGIVPIPGPSAIAAALSVSGVNADKFTFLGYPPQKKGRQTFFKELADVEIRPLVFYESPHRLAKTLEALGDTDIIVAKELTKVHEEVWRGKASDTLKYFSKEKGKGEFVIIVP